MFKLRTTGQNSLSHLHQSVHKVLGWIVGMGMLLIGLVMIAYQEWAGLSYLAFGVSILPIVEIPLPYRLAIATLGLVWLH